MTTKLELAGPGTTSVFKTFFLVAAAYDLILGLAFFFFFGPIFGRLGVPLPGNTSYIHLTAGFIFVQGVSYWLVYGNMLRNTDLVKVGALYKAIYTLVAVYYWMIGQLPHAVFAWFAVFDFLFMLGFLRFLALARPAGAEARPQA
jgi:hypothetical protein